MYQGNLVMKHGSPWVLLGYRHIPGRSHKHTKCYSWNYKTGWKWLFAKLQASPAGPLS